MHPRLDTPDAYEKALLSLVKKWSERGQLYQLETDGVSLADLRGRTRAFSRVLAKTIARGEFRFAALRPTLATFDGKLRRLYRPSLVDAVVLAVTAKYLAAVAEADFSPALHSFRKGRSSANAVRCVSQYFADYRARVPVRERGLYVLQLDISNYGESIDNSPSSVLFAQVERAIRSDPNSSHRELARALIRAAILQPILGHDGTEKPLECGVPTGSPIQPVCANLYLADLDSRFDSVPGAFYSRFGDDLLFVHSEYEMCEWARRELESQLSILNLASNADKQRNLYLNGAGRPSPASPLYGPATCIEYLGLRLPFAGHQGLKLVRGREMRAQLLRRFRNIRATAMSKDPLALAQLMCAAASKALDPAAPLAIRAADRLRRGVDDRSQLKELDYGVALLVAQAATGQRGPRAFRTVSYRMLREMGLTSLVVSRNRKRPARPRP